MLGMLHKHLMQLKREGLISTWTDEEIHAGGKVNQNISNALNRCQTGYISSCICTQNAKKGTY